MNNSCCGIFGQIFLDFSNSPNVVITRLRNRVNMLLYRGILFRTWAGTGSRAHDFILEEPTRLDSCSSVTTVKLDSAQLAEGDGSIRTDVDSRPSVKQSKED